MKNAIILCSGGIDSVTTAHYVKKKLKYKNIIILFFNYKQKTLKNERKYSKNCSKKLNARFKEVELEWLAKISNSLINKSGKIKKLKRKELKNTNQEAKKWYVPCRNTVFLVCALTLAESVYIKNKKTYDIFVGFKCEGGESYPDTTKDFVKKINILSKTSCSKGFKVKAPLINKDKEEIIKLGMRLGIDYKKTHTCYIKEKTHCGYCLSCRLRQEGFYWANIKDPTKYKTKMKDFKIAK